MPETAFNKPEPAIDAKLLRLWKAVANFVRKDPNPKACCKISANHLDALVDCWMERAAMIVAQTDHETALAEAVRAEREKWAAFADEHGEPRKVLGTLPVTADGFVVGEHPEQLGHILWYAWKDGGSETILVNSVMHRCFLPRTRPTREFYSTRESALAAAKEAK